MMENQKFFIEETLHIGKKIKTVLDEQDRRPAWLAKKLNCDSSNIYKILNKPHLDTALLMRISLITGYNFFNCYSDEYAKRIFMIQEGADPNFEI